jgi:glycosyltransferase involved in cell wall biosynthesis
MRCVDTDALQPCYETANPVPLVLHATNHGELKGTSYLVEAAEKLKQKGLHFELKLLGHTPHPEVLSWIKKCDIVADQFLIGAYARFAIEGMALGKPVMCYLREDLYDKNPIWRECPIINTNPDSIEMKLSELLSSRQFRAGIGHQGRVYVERYHSVEYVGSRLNSIIRKIVEHDK